LEVYGGHPLVPDLARDCEIENTMRKTLMIVFLALCSGVLLAVVPITIKIY
jgi:hypothetical protein